MALSESLVILNNDGKKRKLLFPNNSEKEDLKTSVEGMREILIRVCKTPYGNHVVMPEVEEVAAMLAADVRCLFKNFSTICKQLHYRLQEAATLHCTTSTVMHEIFRPNADNRLSAASTIWPNHHATDTHKVPDTRAHEDKATC